MPKNAKKKRIGRRILLAIFISFFLISIGLYLLLSSPRFLLFVISRINHSIPGQIVYDSLNLNLERRTLTASNLRYENEKGEIALSINSLNLGFALTNILRGHLKVRNLAVEGLLFDFKNFPKRDIKTTQWRAILHLIFKRLSISESTLTPIDLKFKDGTKVHLEGTEIKLTPQILQNQKIELKIASSQTKLNGKEITTGALHFLGELDIPILREYPFFVEEAKGGLKIQGVNPPYLEEGIIKTEFKVAGGKISLKNGKFENRDGTIDLDLSYNQKNSGLKLEIKNEKPILFKAIPKLSEKVKETFTGFKIDLNLDVQGKGLKELGGEIDLFLDAFGNRAHDETPDHKLTLKGKFKKDVLNFSLFEIKSNEMELNASGSIDFPRQNLDVKLTTKDFDITTMVNSVAELDLTGNSDAEGTIKGPFKQPDFNMKVTSRKTGYKFLNFGQTVGTFKIEKGDLSFVGGSPSGTPYYTDVNVLVKNIFKKNRVTTLKTEFKNIEASELLENPEIRGKISGTFEMEAVQSPKKTGTLKVTIEDMFLYDFHFAEITTVGKLADNNFTLEPTTFQPPDYEKLTLSKPTLFNFNDRGWTLKGEIQPGITVEGEFKNSQPNKVQVDTTLKNADIRPILASLLMPPQQASVDGNVKMVIGVDEAPSTIDLNFSRFDLPLEEGSLRNDGPVEVSIRPPKILFKQARFWSGEERFEIKGTYTLDGPIDLSMEGKLNLSVLEFVPQFFREASGYANLNLKFSGNFERPRVLGDINFEEAAISLRPVRANIEELSGTIKLTGNSVIFDKLRGQVREGDLNIDGEILLENLKPKFFDLKIGSREAVISEAGVYKLVFSGDFVFKGPAKGPTFSGIMDINDGIYSRDFSITQFFIRPQTAELPKEPNPFLENINLDLRVRSPGQLAIKNNIARMYFNSDITLKGPVKDPKISGALEILDGEFHYFTIDFTGASGVIDFRDPKKGPYCDITVEKSFESSFQTTIVSAHITGFTSNLQLDFSSNPPLEKRDLMSLVFTGAFPGESNRLTGTNIASTVLASQLSQIIQRPLARKAHLDIFRLEASDPDRSSLSTLVVGKKLTDRFSLQFKTDLGVDKPLQGVQAEYLLIDNILIKGTQYSDGEFDFNMALRFKLF